MIEEKDKKYFVIFIKFYVQLFRKKNNVEKGCMNLWIFRKKGRKENNVESSRTCDVQVQELNSLIKTAEDKEKQENQI